jgi:hypothetical protein
MKRIPIVLLALAAATLRAQAADHRDGPSAKADPSTDITDLFTWMSPDGAKLQLVLDVFPSADKANSKFSNAAKYVFHLASQPSFGGITKGIFDLICTFDVSQAASCWLVDRTNDHVLEYLHGDASQPSGLTASDGRMTLFAGPRDDPFFFNLQGFMDAAAFVAQNKGSLLYDSHGCPELDKATSNAAIGILNHSMQGTMPPVDSFHGQNVLAIVVSLDKTLVTDPSDPIVAVWASTNK